MAMQKATAVLGAPGSDAERVKKMMATRPGLNANRRRAPKQDLSGATPQGTIMGRGGRTQQLGKAAMGRLPRPAAAPPEVVSMSAPQGVSASAPPGLQAQSISMEPSANGGMQQTGGGLTAAMAGGGPELQMADKVGRGMTPSPMQPSGDAGFNGGNPPEMERYFAGRVGGSVPGAGGSGGAPPTMSAPAEQAGREAQAMGGGGGTSPYDIALRGGGMTIPGGGQVPPEMAGAVQTALAGAKGGGGFSPGLPPQIMQRLQALRGGGLQGGAGARAGGAPNPRSFADFWQRQQGGAF